MVPVGLCRWCQDRGRSKCVFSITFSSSFTCWSLRQNESSPKEPLRNWRNFPIFHFEILGKKLNRVQKAVGSAKKEMALCQSLTHRRHGNYLNDASP